MSQSPTGTPVHIVLDANVSATGHETHGISLRIVAEYDHTSLVSTFSPGESGELQDIPRPLPWPDTLRGLQPQRFLIPTRDAQHIYKELGLALEGLRTP